MAECNTLKPVITSGKTQQPPGTPDVSLSSKRRSGSFGSSPTRDSNNSAGTGSTSSSPRVSRVRQQSFSKDGSALLEGDSMETQDSEGESKRKMKDKEKKGFFSLMSIFSAPHHHKNTEMHKIFTSLPTTEKLVDDYSCALQRDILIHGRLYVTQSWLCFYANIFSWETLITIPFKSVRAITKEKTALVIPNAIQIAVSNDKYGFSSLVNRDVTYTIIFKCWQNNLLGQPMTPLDLVKAARKAHGESTDVGSALDLWGGDADTDSGAVAVTMPTHVEIGRIPPAPSSSLPLVSDSLPTLSEIDLAPVHGRSDSLPAMPCKPPQGAEPGMSVAMSESDPSDLQCADQTDVNKSPEEQDTSKSSVDALGHKSLLSNFDSPSGSDGRTVVPPDYLDKTSVGGESGASAEYETVSLIEETGEVPCGCSEHIGRTILNDIYGADVETIFRLLFTDSDFMRSFNKAEKTINVEQNEWQVQPDSSRLRDLSYTVALNYSFGPKFTHTTEHQVYSKTGQPGLKHIVDTEVVNHNIPYGDTFYTQCRYCVTRVAHNKTRLRVTANIKFKKSCWGLVKNLIERNAGDGMRTHYTHLDSVLKEHVASLKDKHSRAHRRASRQSTSVVRQRHKRPSTNKSPPFSPPSSTYEAEFSGGRSRDVSPIGMKTIAETRPPSISPVVEKKEEPLLKEEPNKINSLPRVNLALTLLLGILIVSNMMLYHHLMSYTPSNLVTTPPSGSLPPADQKDDVSSEEWFGGEAWQQHLQQQLADTNRETKQLKDALYTFIQTLDKIEMSLSSAKKQLVTALHSVDTVDIENTIPPPPPPSRSTARKSSKPVAHKS